MPPPRPTNSRGRQSGNAGRPSFMAFTTSMEIRLRPDASFHAEAGHHHNPTTRLGAGIIAAEPLIQHAGVFPVRFGSAMAYITPQPTELPATLPAPLGRPHRGH